jgi:RimJ/RimL family protein N-acetyltransferase
MMLKREGTGGGGLLTGQKVTLAPFAEADITPAYLGWLGDPDLMKYSNQRFRRHSVASCRDYLASFAGSDNYFMAVRHDGQLVGTMTAYVAAHHGTADMGLLIGPQGRGLGLGLDAWNTLMAHLFQAGARKVCAGTLRCNGAMLRIMERSGMQADGVRLGQELVDGQPQDILHFARFGAA